MKVPTAAQVASTFTKKQRSIALIIVALAFVMDLLDATIVNVAIPSIQANLHATYAMIQWLVAGYSMAFAVLLITGGRMGDVFGYKKVFLFGITGFTIASLLSGVAPNGSFLVVSRLLQGSMAALMVPQVMSLMQVMYSAEERTKVMGIFGMLGGLAGSLGPIIGGLLIKGNLFGWDWRPIFLINVPVGIFAILAAVKYLPHGKSGHVARLDMTGTGLIMTALTLLVFPLIEGRDLGWPAWTFAMLIASVPVLVTFIRYELKRAKRDGESAALIVPAIFRKSTFVSGVSLNLLLQVAMVGFFLTFTLCLQAGLGFDALKAALTAIPVAVGIGFSLGLSETLVPKLGRIVITMGSVVLAGGFIYTSWLLRHYALAAHAWQFIPGLLLVGFGMGSVMGPIFSVTLQDIDVKHAGAASGMMSAIQQIGSAVGVAIIGMIFFGHIAHSVATQHIAPATAATAKAVNAHNFANAYHAGVILELAVLLVLGVLSFTLPRHFKAVAPETATV